MGWQDETCEREGVDHVRSLNSANLADPDCRLKRWVVGIRDAWARSTTMRTPSSRWSTGDRSETARLAA